MKRCCGCGTYRHCINIVPPWNNGRMADEGIKILVGIDRCILPEIVELWNAGIKTVASCCGHGKLAPSVVVDDASIENMRKFRYKNDPEGAKMREANPESCNPDAVFLLTSQKHY